MASPQVVSEDYGAILSSTLRNYETKLRDNISRGNKLVAWYGMRGRTRMEDGGERLQIPLMHAQNSTADILSGYGLIDTTPQEGITSAFYPWAQLAVSISISHLEERQNSGRHRILNLLQSKIMQAEVSLKELLNNCLVGGRITVSGASGVFLPRIGRLDNNATGPLPLAALIDLTAARSRTDIGGINPATYTWWGNQSVNATGVSTFIGYKKKLNECYNLCSKGQGGAPDLIISDANAWEQYWGGLSLNERYTITDPRKVDVLGGSDALAFRGATWVWDEVCPDTATNAEVVDAIGTHTVSTAFMINTDTMEFVTDSGTNFITTDFVKPENQAARTATILWMGAHVTNNRRKNGQVYNITKTSITS